MNLARVLLRLVVGGFFIGHGTQKLFGWFGGHGLEGTGRFMESLGLRPGRRYAAGAGAGAAEAGGGALLAAGLATPLAAAPLTAVMLTAIRKVGTAARSAPAGPAAEQDGAEAWAHAAGTASELLLMVRVGARQPVQTSSLRRERP